MSTYEYMIWMDQTKRLREKEKIACCSLHINTHIGYKPNKENIQIALNSNENLWKLWIKSGICANTVFFFVRLEFHPKKTAFIFKLLGSKEKLQKQIDYEILMV